MKKIAERDMEMMAACAQQEGCEGCQYERECHHTGEFRMVALPRAIGVVTPVKPMGN